MGVIGIKMSRAYFQVGNRVIDVSDAAHIDSADLKHNLYCVKCSAPLSFVPSYSRHYGDGDEVFVAAHFKLRPNGPGHSDVCAFNAAAQVEQLARVSPGVLQSIRQGKYELRLKSPGRLADKAKPKPNTALNGEAREGSGTRSTYKRRTDEMLPAYLPTVKRIMLLWATIDAEADLGSLIVINFNGLKVNWRDFAYRRDDYAKCFEWIGVHKNYPAVIEGQVKAIKPPSLEHPETSIQLRSSVSQPDDDGVSHVYTVWLSVNDDLGQNLKEGDTLYVYGFPWVRHPKPDQKVVYHNLSIPVDFRQQIAAKRH